jgi:hypothetical protein
MGCINPFFPRNGEILDDEVFFSDERETWEEREKEDA